MQSSVEVSMTKNLAERLENLEGSLEGGTQGGTQSGSQGGTLGGSQENIPIPKDVYSRLKALEDKIILIEKNAPNFQNQMEEIEVKNSAENRKTELSQSLIEINNEISKLRNELMN